DADCLGATELPVLQIDVVDDLRDGTHCRIVYREPGAQDLEGAEIALVRELGLEHVEAELARLGTISLARYEFEPRVRVDDAPNQPGARDPIDVDALPRTFNEARFAHRSVAAALDDLAQQPLEVLLRVVGPGCHVYRVLDRHRPHRLQPPPDFH